LRGDQLTCTGTMVGFQDTCAAEIQCTQRHWYSHSRVQRSPYGRVTFLYSRVTVMMGMGRQHGCRTQRQPVVWRDCWQIGMLPTEQCIAQFALLPTDGSTVTDAPQQAKSQRQGQTAFNRHWYLLLAQPKCAQLPPTLYLYFLPQHPLFVFPPLHPLPPPPPGSEAPHPT
jgi:hypothetical protein